VKYVGTSVVFDEVPGEISLAFFISGCPHMCSGCHSEHLRKDIGRDLDMPSLVKELDTYDKYCTCVLFMGGDQYDNLIDVALYARYKGYKTALYTGSDTISYELLDALDYCKTGRYIAELGPLTSKTTNQVMIKYTHEDGWFDITNEFWRFK
jgi:anaerobic ribonucleoside-triphosphate reductase activating protein